MQKLFPRKLALLAGLLALLVSLPLASNQASVPSSRYRFYVQAKSRAEVRRLSGWLNKNEFDVAGVNFHTGVLEVLTSETGVAYLKDHGLTGRLVSVQIAGGHSAHLTDLDSRYLDPAKVSKRLSDINAKYPKVTRVIEIGRSLNNLPILGLIISTTLDTNVPAFHEKPTVLVDGMHHAREIMTPEIVLDIADTLLASSFRNSRARNIVEGINLVLVPMLNVDGNTKVWNDDTMWRKNAHAQGRSVFGVDINRNYPYRWANCDGSSSDKGAQDYHGASAASEPETQALMNIADRVHPMASLSYHSYSELVIYPFGCDGEFTSENALLSKLGNEMANLLPSDDGNGHYAPGTPWQLLYAVDGDSMGYLFSTYGAVAYTFEVNQSFQPSYDLREPTLKKHRAAWSYFLDQIQQHLETFHVQDASGKPVLADIEIKEIPHTKGERTFATNVAGNYFKVLLPGQYTVHVKTKDGRSGSADLMMADSPSKTTITVQ
jgi:carboxypeptidase T